jgi:hypothetical protein
MKKTIITAFTLLSVLIANAQINKGAKALGFNLAANYNLNKSSNERNSNTSATETTRNTLGFAVQPVFEYFVVTNLSLGVGLNYSINTINEKTTLGTNIYDYNYNFKNYGLQVQFKKYWFATNKIAFTLTPAIAASYIENSYVQSNNFGSPEFKGNSDYWQYGIGGNLGAAFFIKQNLTIEGQTNFFSYSYSPETSKTNITNNIAVSFIPTNLSLGFKFIFGNKTNNVN